MLNIKGIAMSVAGAALTLSLIAPTWGPALAAQQDAQGAAPAATTQLMGGWQAQKTPSQVGDSERQIFDSAMAGYMGVSLEPVCVLATQVVAGTNYAYLVQATPISPDTEPYWCIIVLYQDLAGNVSFVCKNDIDLADIHVTDAAQGAAVGGWQVSEDAGTNMLPQRAATAFSGALADYVGMGFNPVALLGTQVVSGTNYKFLCVGTTVTAEPTSGLYVVTVYENLDGKATVSSVERLDLNSYVTAPAAEVLDEEVGADIVSESGKPSARRELAEKEPEPEVVRTATLSDSLAKRKAQLEG